LLTWIVTMSGVRPVLRRRSGRIIPRRNR